MKRAINLEKIGKVQCRHNYYIDLSKLNKFRNPRVSFNGRVWVLSVAVEIEVEAKKEQLNNFTVRVDLGSKHFQ